MERKTKKDAHVKNLFRDPSGQNELFEKSYQQEVEEKAKRQVECLGMTFENDEARRAYFLEKLKEKLKDPEFRKIEGFPIGSDEDILTLSDPPYYTACPNPFIEDFIRCYGKPYDPKTDNYRREPFAADVSEGKNDPIYNAHSYHTKVPHKAIMRYILHYTEPGDVVFDGFGGTGMTGVAAQLCDSKKEVESLGYKVRSDGAILDEKGRKFSKIGGRRAILNDLSPAATFIACNYNTPVDVKAFEREVKRILKEAEEECGWMYETSHSDGKTKGRVNYTVWSDVFICPECTREVVFWEAAMDKKAGKVKDEFLCPHCHVRLTKRNMDRAWETKFDKVINRTIRQAKRVPVLIKYSVGKNRYEKTPDEFDLALIEKIEQRTIPYWFPTDRMPEGDESRRNDDIGITHVHHFYTKRSLTILSTLLGKTQKISNQRDRSISRFLFEQWIIGFSRLNRYSPHHFSQNNRNLSGTLYVGSQISEVSSDYAFTEKIKRLISAFKKANFLYSSLLTTEDTSSTQIVEAGVDYIFTDPPFGGNLMYSELNFLWEAWLKVFTNNIPEAIENSAQGKGLVEYQRLMTRCFQEYYRVLKPGRWMTVEFHNSKNSVWNAIQEALQHAGFVVADVRTLDKQQGTFKQVTSGGAVKQDLVISAYKPNSGLEARFKIDAGTEEGVWDFIRIHMKQLPVFVPKDGQAEVVAERQNYLLFDRMVAFHVQRGVTVPLSAAEFYQGLVQRFPQREGMYFLSDQVAEYDRKRMTVKEMLQLELFVTDESSAIQWLRQQLTKKPQTGGELKPQFMQEIGGWQKNEKLLELDEFLAQNFIYYDGKGEVPSQIHSYLSTNFKDFRNLAKDDPVLCVKAKDRWYVPDPNKAGDLEKLRERSLLKEFDEYRESKQRQLKVFRLEAVRAGFKKAWQERDYKTIIEVARRIPENVLQEDPKLLMWYDQALTRTGGD
jgi:DNA modification methylase/rubredoxin